mmetsp:Transcript_45824/g.112642  ORF Transcript_45824/g.112642 Transcript_45824/m.112642 type:complete len:321 (+) Transcript_45824:3-965(+)
MHENCNITCAQNEALKLLEGILTVSAKGSGGGEGKSYEQQCDAIAEGILAKVPEIFELDVVEANFPTMYEESMNTVVKQEALRYNTLLNIMRWSLPEFRKALKGLVVMTEQLENMGKALFTNQVPDLWADKGPLSLKPLSAWILDCVERVAFLEAWTSHGTPKVYWISGFFFPQAFLTGALQNYARKYQLAIDTLGFGFQIRDDIMDPKTEILKKPDDGVFVYGLFLEGCRWDDNKHLLSDSRPKELYSELPTMHLQPAVEYKSPKTDYNCPCYKVLSRKGVLLTTGHSTNFVMWVDLPSDRPQSVWIKAGVGLFLALRT